MVRRTGLTSSTRRPYKNANKSRGPEEEAGNRESQGQTINSRSNRKQDHKQSVKELMKRS